MYFHDEILRTGSVNWYFPGARMTLPASSVAKLLNQGPLPRLSMSGTSGPEPEVKLFGHAISMPAFRMEVTNLLLANGPALASTIHQVPAWTPVTIAIEAYDRTACVFTLEEAVNAPEDATPPDPQP